MEENAFWLQRMGSEKHLYYIYKLELCKRRLMTPLETESGILKSRR